MHAAAGPRPLFQLPFACNQRVRLATYPGHDDYDIDMTLPDFNDWGHPIVASYQGRVSFAGINGTLGGRTPSNPDGPMGTGGGWMVKLDHGDGWETLYLHMLERPVVETGQSVTRGQLLGKVGSTGKSSGPHLHYEQLRDGAKTESWFNGVRSGITDDGTSDPRVVESHNCGGGDRKGGPRADFDGDGVDDIGLYRRSNGEWHIKSVKKNDVLHSRHVYGGQASDMPVVGDFDGDGFSDIALYRHSDGQWHIKSVKKNDVLHSGHSYGGQDSDTPLVGDFDGDGADDIAVYRRSNGEWHIKSVKKNDVLHSRHVYGGQASDMPVVGDFDGDGFDDIAVYRRNNGEWHIKSVKKNDVLHSRHSYGGFDSDIPMAGDFDGDGADDITLYRHSNGQWHIKSVKKNDVLHGSHQYGGYDSDIPINK